MNICRHCKLDKPGMYSQPQTRVYRGKVYKYQYFVCRDCNVKNCKTYRNTPSGKVSVHESVARFESSNPVKRKAWSKAQSIKRLPCEVCGDKNTHRHHPDYSKPLEVKHLCPLHHKLAHKTAISIV